MSRLLLIDDEADVQYSFQRLFDSPEIELATASSGEEGLRLVPKFKPDLVIMGVAGHVSRKMLEHYSRIRTEAKRAALEAISGPVFGAGVHQNVHQLPGSDSASDAKRLN